MKIMSEQFSLLLSRISSFPDVEKTLKFLGCFLEFLFYLQLGKALTKK